MAATDLTNEADVTYPPGYPMAQLYEPYTPPPVNEWTGMPDVPAASVPVGGIPPYIRDAWMTLTDPLTRQRALERSAAVLGPRFSGPARLAASLNPSVSQVLQPYETYGEGLSSQLLPETPPFFPGSALGEATDLAFKSVAPTVKGIVGAANRIPQSLEQMVGNVSPGAGAFESRQAQRVALGSRAEDEFSKLLRESQNPKLADMVASDQTPVDAYKALRGDEARKLASDQQVKLLSEYILDPNTNRHQREWAVGRLNELVPGMEIGIGDVPALAGMKPKTELEAALSDVVDRIVAPTAEAPKTPLADRIAEQSKRIADRQIATTPEEIARQQAAADQMAVGAGRRRGQFKVGGVPVQTNEHGQITNLQEMIDAITKKGGVQQGLFQDLADYQPLPVNDPAAFGTFKPGEFMDTAPNTALESTHPYTQYQRKPTVPEPVVTPDPLKDPYVPGQQRLGLPSESGGLQQLPEGKTLEDIIGEVRAANGELVPAKGDFTNPFGTLTQEQLDNMRVFGQSGTPEIPGAGGAQPPPPPKGGKQLGFGPEDNSFRARAARTFQDANLVDIMATPKALLATGDISATFRQALAFIAHPVAFGKGVVNQVRSIPSQEFFQQLYDAQQIRSAGNGLDTLYLGHTGGGVFRGAEDFASRYIEALPKPLRAIVHGSERAFLAMTNTVRVEAANGVVEGMMRGEGVDLANNAAKTEWIMRNKSRIDAVADVVNHASGRGFAAPKDINIHGIKIESNTAQDMVNMANAFMFSPQFAASRVRFLGDTMGAVLKIARGRGDAADLEAVRLAAGYVAGVAGMWQIFNFAHPDTPIQLNPLHSNFGKIYLGKAASGKGPESFIASTIGLSPQTDTRRGDIYIDLMAGESQYIRTMSRILAGMTQAGIKALGGRRVNQLDTIMRSGRHVDVTNPQYGEQNLEDMLFNFLRNISSPPLSAGLDTLRDPNSMFSIDAINHPIANMLIPLSLQDYLTSEGIGVKHGKTYDPSQEIIK